MLFDIGLHYATRAQSHFADTAFFYSTLLRAMTPLHTALELWSQSRRSGNHPNGTSLVVVNVPCSRLHCICASTWCWRDVEFVDTLCILLCANVPRGNSLGGGGGDDDATAKRMDGRTPSDPFPIPWRSPSPSSPPPFPPLPPDIA